MTESADTRLARIETKVDVLLETTRDFKAKFTSYDVRLGELEQFDAKLLGIAAALAVVVSLIVKAL